MVALALVCPSLLLGMGINFSIGSCLRMKFGGETTWFPRYSAHLVSLKSAFIKTPFVLSFWVNCSPIPIALRYFLVGRLIQVPYLHFLAACWVHWMIVFIPMTIIACQAKELDDALDTTSPEKIVTA